MVKRRTLISSVYVRTPHKCYVGSEAFAMADTQRQVTPIDDNEPGAAGLRAQAAQLEGVLERLRVLTQPDSVERAMLVASLEKLLPDKDE